MIMYEQLKTFFFRLCVQLYWKVLIVKQNSIFNIQFPFHYESLPFKLSFRSLLTAQVLYIIHETGNYIHKKSAMVLFSIRTKTRCFLNNCTSKTLKAHTIFLSHLSSTAANCFLWLKKKIQHTKTSEYKSSVTTLSLTIFCT